jgi:hypothetical protein
VEVAEAAEVAEAEVAEAEVAEAEVAEEVAAVGRQGWCT